MVQFLLLAVLLCFSADAQQYEYLTSVQKGPSNAPLVGRPRTAVPAGVCNAELGQDSFCDNGDTPVAVRVTVADDVTYPDVILDNLMSSVMIRRQADGSGQCSDEAQVLLESYCVSG